MLTIGLTGGIGSGKTTVSDIFTSLGVPVIDSDVIAREVVMPGEQGLESVIKRFGSEVLQADGTLDRKKLRNIVFDDKQARQDLEQILHPLIKRRSREHMEELDTPYAIQAIPLLLETGQEESFDRILVVDCPVEVQIERICARDGITREQAEAILASQTSRERRLAAADDVIVNDQPIETVRHEIELLHEKYLQLAPGSGPEPQLQMPET